MSGNADVHTGRARHQRLATLATKGNARRAVPPRAVLPRAGLISAYFIVSYAAFGIPVVVAGLATTHVGLHRTALVYCVTIAVLAAVAAGSLLVRRRSRPGASLPGAGNHVA